MDGRRSEISSGDFFRDIGAQVDNFEDAVSRGIEQSEDFVRKSTDVSEELQDQAVGFHNSWFFEHSENPVSGEAFAFHPNNFAGFTPLRFIGVTRIPETTAKVGRFIFDHRKGITGAISRTKNLKLKFPKMNGKVSKSGRKISARIKKVKNPLPKTTARLKKSPRVAGTATGIAVSTVFTGTSMTQTETSEEDLAGIFVPRKKRRGVSRWV